MDEGPLVLAIAMREGGELGMKTDAGVGEVGGVGSGIAS